MSCCQDCCDDCCDDCCQDCTDSCNEACTCDTCCQDCCGSISCCDGCNCCGNASGIPIFRINTFTSFTIMMLSLASGIIGIFEQVPISITILSIGLILTAFTILGLILFPRISRREWNLDKFCIRSLLFFWLHF